MASRINTKFVLILVAALVLGGGIFGALLFMQYGSDATRNIRQGDAAVAAGDLKKAMDFYGRAVHKQPGNMEYLQKYEDVLRKMKPQTTDEGVKLYQQLLSVM